LDLKDIKDLIALMRKNDLSVFKMEREGFKITLKRGSDYQPVLATTTPLVLPQLTAPASAGDAVPTAPAGSEAKGATYQEITSPMVGTFYASATPEAAPYVSVGQTITEDTVVCIIEAMKVMNEIKAELSGTVVEVVAENGKPVQFGQVLFRVR